MATKKAKNKKTSKQKKPKNKKVRDALAITLSILGALIIVAIILLLKFCHNPKKETVLDIQKNEQGQTVCYGFKKGVGEEQILEEFGDTLVIPEGVQIVAAGAFVEKLPDEIVRLVFSGNQCADIENRAFSGTKLSVIDLPTKLNHIGTNAFSATQIVNITLPATLCSDSKTIDDGAFASCLKLNSINLRLWQEAKPSSFGNDVFGGAEQVNGVISVADNPSNLYWDWKDFFVDQQFVFGEGKWHIKPTCAEVLEVNTSGKLLGFYKNAQDYEIANVLKDTINIGDNISTIAENAFINQSGQSTIPSFITKLTFDRTADLEIGASAFRKFVTLQENFELPSSVKSTGGGVFSETNIKSLILYPETNIGNGTFAECSTLSDIDLTNFEIAQPTWGNDVFKPESNEGSGIIHIKKASDKDAWKNYLHNVQGFTFDDTHWKIEAQEQDTVLDIDGNILKGFKSDATKDQILEEFKDGIMTIPDTVTSIDNDAFRDADPRVWSRSIPEEIKTLTFVAPKKIQDIGARAFAFNKFEKINLNSMSALESIGEHAFAGCSNLKTFAEDDNTLSLCDNVTYIGIGAFDGCKAIKSIKLPAISKETKICEFAFATGDLTTIDLSKLEIILDGNEYSRDCSMWYLMENSYIFSGLGSNGSIILPKYVQGGVWDKTTAFLLAETKEESVLAQTNSGFNWIFSYLSLEEGIKLLDWTLVE